MIVKHAWPLAVLAVAVGNANAEQAQTEQEARLDKQVITATRVQEDVASIPQTVLVIEGEKLAQQIKAGQSVEQILATMVPGMGPADNSMTNYYQSLRGRQVLVLIDGVAQRSNRNVSRQLSVIHPSNIERIEVISGASSIYGSGATGGIINIITRQGADALAMRTEVKVKQFEGGNDDSLGYSLSQSVEGGNEQMRGGAYLNYETTGVFIDADGDQIAPDRNQIASDEAETLDLLLKGSFKFDANKQLSASAAYYNQEKDSDYAPGFGDDTYQLSFGGFPLDTQLPDAWVTAVGDSDYEPYPVKGLQLDKQPKTERKALTLDYSDSDFFGQRLLAQTEYRESQYRYFPYPDRTMHYDFDWNGVMASVLGGASTTQALLGNFNGIYLGVNQSTMETQVWDTKVALTTPTFVTPVGDLTLTYGLDYTQDTGKQTATEYDLATLRDSGYTQYEATGNEYKAGPEATTETYAAFLQSELAIDKVTVRAGLRYEKTTAEIEDFINVTDEQSAAYYESLAADTTVQTLAAANGMTPQQFLDFVYETSLGGQTVYSDDLVEHESGSKDYDAWLANLGAVYEITANHQVFANYSQGYDVPDFTRLLRGVTLSTAAGQQSNVLNSINVDATKTYSYELGWRGFGDRWNAFATVYQNQSDQTVLFDQVTGEASIASQKERFWGLESGVSVDVTPKVEAGLGYAYTRGESKDESEGWYSLGVDRVAPAKWTTFVGYNEAGQYSVRLQSQTLMNYSKGHNEAPDDSTAAQTVPFKGYTLVDLMGSVALPVGELGLAVNNVMNQDYMPLYNQVRGYAATGAASWLPGTGREYVVSYSVAY